jgi:predicted helicase
MNIKGFKVDDLFPVNTSGIKTGNDNSLVSFVGFEENNHKYHYRVFDDRFIEYDLKKVLKNRYNVMKNILKKDENISLITTKQESTFDFQHVFLSKLLIDINSISHQTKEISHVFPLYLYPETKDQQTTGQSSKRVPNLNAEIVQQFAQKLGLSFIPEKEPEGNVCYINNPEVRDDYKTTFAPMDILDYIYAVLHSPTYRKKYNEFLKIDFPHVPFPQNSDTFWKLAGVGEQIRKVHLMESAVLENPITQYPVDGDHLVGKISAKPGISNGNEFVDVYINKNQFFANVPVLAWEFYIGGYQPAQKWLKDRKGRQLNFTDLIHYQKIIVALTETHRLMQIADGILKLKL